MAEVQWFLLVHEDSIMFTLLVLGAIGALAVVAGLFRIVVWPLLHRDGDTLPAPEHAAPFTPGSAEATRGVPE